MRAFHCTWTLLLPLLLLARPATGQDRQQGYTIFFRGTPAGHQDVTVRSDAQGLLISGQGQITEPVDVITRRAELRYRPDLTADSMAIVARIGGVDITLNTKFENGSAVSTGMQGTLPFMTTDMASPLSVLLPNVFFGSHAVLARRLAGAAPGAEFRAYVGPGPGAQVTFRLRTETTEQMQFGTSTFDVHHYELIFDNAGAPLAIHLYADNVGGLVRVDVPAQSIQVVRDDLAGSISRSHVTSNPGDEAVILPAAGFND